MRVLWGLLICLLVAVFSILGLASAILTVLCASLGEPIGFLFLASAVAFYTTAIVLDGLT